jgi:hypothetical protein
MSSLEVVRAHLHGHYVIVATAAFCAVLLAVALLAWRTAAARLLLVIGVVQLGVLIAAPPYFRAYADYVAPTLALLVAAAAQPRPGRSRSRVGTAAMAGVVAAAAILTFGAGFVRSVGFIRPFPTAKLAAQLPPARCVMTVYPMALIELDRLSSDLANRCPDWVDVMGRSFDVDAAHATRYVPRGHNRKWQADVRRYLLSGSAALLVGRAGGLDAATLAALRRHPLLDRSGRYALYWTARTAPR